MSHSQQNITAAIFSFSKYKLDSKEQQTKVEAIAKWIGCTGLPVTTVEDEDFILMMETIDKKLTVPKKTKISNLIDKLYDAESQKFKKRLAAARKVSIGIDLWTKKGLTASFLAISACYFCPELQSPQHILLALEQVAHPHTAQVIKACVDKCIQDWGIENEKVITVITDNGSNMVAAFKNTIPEGEETTTEDSETENSLVTEWDSEGEDDDQR